MIMEGIEGIIEFISDVSEAFHLSSHYYKWEIVGRKVENREIDGINEEVVVDDGVRVRIGWNGEDYWGSLTKPDGTSYSLYEAYIKMGLVEKYGAFIFCEDAEESEDYSIRLEKALKNELFKCAGMEQRIYIIKELVSNAASLILSREFRRVSNAMYSITCNGSFSYNDYGTDEEVTIYRDGDKSGILNAFEITDFLLSNGEGLLFSIGNICHLWNIDLVKAVQEVVNIRGHMELVNWDMFGLREPISVNEPVQAIVGNAKQATVLQRWLVLRSLMEMAVDWRLTDDDNRLNYNKTDIADFLCFLCGGSAQRTRKMLEEDIPPKDVAGIIPYLDKIGLAKVAEYIKKR